MKKSKEIKILIEEVEKKMGKKLVSPNDYKELIAAIYDKKARRADMISISTIKRLWGYVENKHTYRFNTVSVLARYVGYKDWSDFCEKLELRGESDSDFITEKQIKTEELNEGDIIEIGWNPDRRCILCYLGDYTFRVESAENCKLSAGDTFKAIIFSLGFPLYVSSLNCSAGSGLSYVAGQKHGLTVLKHL